MNNSINEDFQGSPKRNTPNELQKIASWTFAWRCSESLDEKKIILRMID